MSNSKKVIKSISVFKNIFIILFFVFISCKHNNILVKNKVEKEITKKNILKNKSKKPISYYREKGYERKENETAIDFINRIYNNSINLNHPIIETNNWINGKNMILVFFNKELEDDLGVDVKGFIYVSKDKKTYRQFIIDTYEPAGRNAKVETIFFANADEDKNKELIILCSWKQRLKEIAEGKLYETYIYDYNDKIKKSSKIIYLEEISNHFGVEFEGIQDGVKSIAKYKTAEDIKIELKKFN